MISVPIVYARPLVIVTGLADGTETTKPAAFEAFNTTVVLSIFRVTPGSRILPWLRAKLRAKEPRGTARLSFIIE